MYDLYATYYDATSPSLFEKDLGDKDWWSSCGTNPECSSDSRALRFVDATIGGRGLRAIYFGDTIVGRTYGRGSIG
jgi:hypothetical protein